MDGILRLIAIIGVLSVLGWLLEGFLSLWDYLSAYCHATKLHRPVRSEESPAQGRQA